NDQSSIAISKTVYNTIYFIHQERLNSHISVQAFFDELQEFDFEFEY
ncbi:23358_t:CDS:1, partial [Racocetra persica]